MKAFYDTVMSDQNVKYVKTLKRYDRSLMRE